MPNPSATHIIGNDDQHGEFKLMMVVECKVDQVLERAPL